MELLLPQPLRWSYITSILWSHWQEDGCLVKYQCGSWGGKGEGRRRVPLPGLLNFVIPGSLCNYVVLPQLSRRRQSPERWSNVVMESDVCICWQGYGHCSVVPDWRCALVVLFSWNIHCFTASVTVSVLSLRFLTLPSSWDVLPCCCCL